MVFLLALIPFYKQDLSFTDSLVSTLDFWSGPILGVLTFGLLVSHLISYFKKKDSKK